MRKTFVAAAAAVLFSSATALAGPTDAQKCESGKDKVAGKYAQCMLNAQSKLVKSGGLDMTKYNESVVKCDDKYDGKWRKLEFKADGACPSTGDETEIQDFLDACVVSAEDALAGGALPSDVVLCNSDLATCQGDLSTTNSDLTTCEGDLSTTNADLTSCEGDLATCEASLGLPATGQTTSYGTGSDGDLQRGVVRSFTDNGDGTITDNVTGLMWEKKSDDGSIHDKDVTYTWSTGTNTMDGTIVTGFLATLNGGGGFAGYTDWRIPNIYELQSLVNFQILWPGPAVFPEFSSGCTGGCAVTTCSCTQSGNHWSSPTYQDAPSYAWYVDFNDGYVAADLKTDGGFVRAVRAGS